MDVKRDTGEYVNGTLVSESRSFEWPTGSNHQHSMEIAEGNLVGFIVNNKFKALIFGPFQVARESALAFNPDVSIKAFHDNIMR